jgi:hypothetical protein
MTEFMLSTFIILIAYTWGKKELSDQNMMNIAQFLFINETKGELAACPNRLLHNTFQSSSMLI